jgi:imidazolonepropionase-like amidohydrolase
MVQAGMTPMQAIVAGTNSAAELLGWEQQVGTIAVGRYADLAAVRGNPLNEIELLETPQWVMKGGEVVKAP